MNSSLIQLPLKDVEALFAASSIEILDANQDKTPAKTLADLSKEQIEAATNKYDALEGARATVTKRTIQRWKKKILGLSRPLDKIIALVDDTRSKGNKTSRLPQRAEEFAGEIIKTRYNTPTCPTATGAYHEYEVLCAENNVRPMSFPTFTKRVNNQHSVKAREGNRKNYQESPIPLLLDYASPIHGVLPHEVCYIDHTIMNIALVGPGGTHLGKPTFTLATDGHTTQARAFYLSFDPPSINVVYMALRDYVRRWRRLPRRLVVDRGPEFRSEELKWFCRLYGIDIILRPKAMPRGGSLIERAIGATESELLAQLEGNTRIMKNVRMVTKSVDPGPRAEWTLPALHGALDDYLFEIRPERIHPAFGMTPKEYEQMRILETGARKHLLVRFDENLLLLTSSHAARPYHKVDPVRGVWEGSTYYWHDGFKNTSKGEDVEVRIEQWNANVIYVYFRKKWVAAIARDLRPFAGRTREEVQIAIRAERRLAKTNANKDRLGARNAKRMVGLRSPGKYDPRIGLQQREKAYLYSKLGMTTTLAIVGENHQEGNAPFALDTTLPNSELAMMEAGANPSTSAYKVAGENLDSEFWGGIDEFV